VITITASLESWSVDYKELKAQGKRHKELLENSENSNNSRTNIKQVIIPESEEGRWGKRDFCKYVLQD